VRRQRAVKHGIRNWIEAFVSVARGVLDQLVQRGAMRLPTVH